MEKLIVKRILIISSFLCFAVSMLAADMHTDSVQLGIREAEKKVYTVESPISLQVNLHNNTAAPYLFELAGNKIFNIELEVSNLYNEALSASENYIRERTSNQQVYYRDIRILPGEEFSFYIQMEDFIDLDSPGIYFIKASFFPHLGARTTLDSNTITIHVHPSDTGSGNLDEIIAIEKDEVLKKRQLPPDQVVEYTLSARQHDEWEKFFLYLDLEQLMLQNKLKNAEYRRSADAERVRMVNTYRELLMNQQVDNDILLKPADFSIEKTVYTPENAEVRVSAEFRYPDYTEIRHYLYYLHRPEGYWTIYKYQVTGQETQ